MRTAGEKRPSFVKKDDGRIVWELEIEVLTPMFGGGVVVDGHKKPFDPVTPIRAASIRGQLRFWWRAVNPRGCKTVAELAEAEAEIFGAAGRAGGVDVSVENPSTKPSEFPVLGQGFRAASYAGRELKGLAYGGFPLRGEGTDHGTLRRFATDSPFRLTIGFPQSEQLVRDLHAAIWAWVRFGGIGGRTRRGFGAVHAKKTPPIDSGWPAHADAEWLPVAANVEGRSWPTIPSDRSFALAERATATKDPILAHDELLGYLRELRQGRAGRAPGGGNRPGRSYWPEADSIRALYPVAPGHPHATPQTSPRAFPRAVFGTPIIFHFQGHGEPPDTTLNPVGRGRLASSLLLRPARAGKDALTLRALRLHHPECEYELGPRGDRVATRLASPEISVVPPEGQARRPSPLIKGDFRTTDPIARFFKELDK